ncbi:G-protein coupled receptors family 1 profile domain-containing protein [Caenorhabditis elegans]|uniref:G-protein coupled receptors family 1 profile domain-containing protein n=1 Tax=Caenorhabditis elegans TaxID=6239 RepID=Q22674_CAEEL|nr:G-protein coupled receptors family 1 profile domain-containing protein [Caenorhabditis elegans]CAA88873.3 G-protein coupled receptors family 1 profile domain-containing protein [Caenorhabditis elegans]|eukprot:NP_495829.3 Uncharacterized protein CELE_T22C8.1 [Caenorhabditis elegans]
METTQTTEIATDYSLIETTSVIPENSTLLLVTDDPGKGALILNETLTDLNVTTTEYIPIVAAATAFASLIAIGAFAVTIFIIVLIRGRKRFQEFPFFAIVYHLTAANAIHILLQLTTVLPIMLLDSDEESTNRYWYKVGSYGIMLTEQASLYFTLLMTINRFAVFVFPSILSVFTTKGIHIISTFIWVYINFIVFWNYNFGTTKTFSRKTISMKEVLLGTNILTKFFTLSSTCLPIAMLGMYLVIFIFIVKKRQIADNTNQKKTDRDTSLVVQALIITIALECVNITDILTPLFKNADLSIQWIWTIFCYCTTISNQLVNPLFFLTVNKMVRSVAKHIFDKNISSFLSDTSSTNKVPDRRRIQANTKKLCCGCCAWLFKDEQKERTVVTF